MVVVPLKEYPLETTRQIQPGVSKSDIEDPYRQYAKSLEQLGSAAETTATALATPAGYSAVTRDAAGNVQIEKAPFIGPAAAQYEHATRMAALVNYEGDARRTDIALRQEFRNDPEGYRTAADKFVGDLELKARKVGGPELGIAVRRGVELTTTQTYKGLLNEKERLDLQRNVGDIESEIKFTENQQYALVRQGALTMPGDSDVRKNFDANNSKIDTLYGALGNNPRLGIGPEKLKYAKSQFNDELFVQGVSHHVVDDVYGSQGYDAAEKAAADIRTNPKLNLTPQQRDTAYSRIMSELNAKVRGEQLVTTTISNEIQNLGQQATDGYPPTPERLGQLRAAAENAKQPQLLPAINALEANAKTMQQWAQMNPAQLEATITGLDRTMRERGGSEQGIALKNAGLKLLQTMRTQIGADALGWAARTGVMPVPPIPFGTKDAAAGMADRVTRAELVARTYGTTPTYLRPDEVSALTVAGAAGGDTMIGLSRMLVDGFGDRAPKVMAEISKNAPTLAHIGALMQSGGNTAFAVDVADAAKMQNDKEFKLPSWMAKPSDKVLTVQQGRTRDVYGAAFALSPDTARAAEGAAKDAFFTRAVRNGYDPLLPDSKSKGAYDQALQESAGARFVGGQQYGGVGTYSMSGWYGSRTANKVLVPPSVKVDKFADAIGAITADDLSKMGVSPQTADGRAYTPADLRAAVPIATRGGYRFALGDPHSEDPKYIRGADGRPWVLDFGQMEERLRARVPGAFLGK